MFSEIVKKFADFVNDQNIGSAFTLAPVPDPDGCQTGAVGTKHIPAIDVTDIDRFLRKDAKLLTCDMEQTRIRFFERIVAAHDNLFRIEEPR